MKRKRLLSKIPMGVNYLFLAAIAFLCLLPVINLFAVSFSARSLVEANQVTFLPKGFTTGSYEYIFQNRQFFNSFGISIRRVLVGWFVNIVLTVLVAYPLSKEKTLFRCRGFYVWFFLITMVFSGGLIPTFLIVSKVGLVNSFWALIIPDAVQMFYVMLMLNFFREIPRGIEEAAIVDGAGWFLTLVKVYLPLSKPSLATISLFAIVNQWNAWFDGLIYMNLPDNYPLMTWLQSMVLNFDLNKITSEMLMLNPILLEVTGRSARAAMIMVCTLPILISYPFLQKYFVTGITLGSVKG